MIFKRKQFLYSSHAEQVISNLQISVNLKVKHLRNALEVIWRHVFCDVDIYKSFSKLISGSDPGI